MNRKHLSAGLLIVQVLLPALALRAQEPANPELVGTLAKEIGATSQQAEGAAGALFGLAKTRLKPEEWSKVAGAVPGMDGLLKAVPAVASSPEGALAGALSSTTLPSASGLGGLASVAGTFKQLGLKPEMAMKAVPILTDYVSKTGGADVGKILSGALK